MDVRHTRQISACSTTVLVDVTIGDELSAPLVRCTNPLLVAHSVVYDVRRAVSDNTVLPRSGLLLHSAMFVSVSQWSRNQLAITLRLCRLPLSQPPETFRFFVLSLFASAITATKRQNLTLNQSVCETSC
jgi:hypothetical protein